ncbi:thiolase-like protein [Melanogaster broomeanus]|nr:thiolase-like protein [Melanogaster broomeanus]
MGSLTTPSPAVQEAAIWLSYRDAGLHPSQADFVGLYGMGTVVGDATEVNRAGAVFAEGRDGRDVLIGSVESNVGHGGLGQAFLCLTSAYMTSLVKVAMMLENKQVLPKGYFKKPSSRIDFAGYNLRVPVMVEDFIPGDPTVGRIASISSYGFGGTRNSLRRHFPFHSPLYVLFRCGRACRSL